jgi:hypothetical protein
MHPSGPSYFPSDSVGATGHIAFVLACIAVGTVLTMGVLAVGELRGSGSLLARHMDQAAAIAQMDPPRLPFLQTSTTAQR